MTKAWLVISVFTLLISLLLVGCTVSQEKYDTLAIQLDKAEEKLQSVNAALELAQVKLETAQSEIEMYQSRVESISEQKEWLVDAHTELTKENHSLKEELGEIKLVYPPRHFYNMEELQEWLSKNNVSDRPASMTHEDLYAKTLDLQEDALNDGYIISAWIDYNKYTDYYRILCSAVADGTIYMWNVESDELTNFSEASGLLEVR